MTGLVRKATLFAACGLLMAGAAFASVPSPGNSDIGCGINLVAHNTAGDADCFEVFNVGGKFCVTVRDGNNVPIANSTVIIDFANCCNDIVIAQSQPGNAGCGVGPATVDCLTNTVRALTDMNGNVCFLIIGAASASDPTPGNGQASACARVFADGTLLGNLQVGAFDLNGGIPGGEGLSGADLSVWLGDFFDYFGSAIYRDRSDFDFGEVCNPPNQSISGADLAVWLGQFFNSFSTGSSATNGPFCACP